MSHQVEKVVQCFRQAERAATVTGAAILSCDKNRIMVSSTWSQSNLERKTDMTSELHQGIDLSTGRIFNCCPAVDISGQLLSKYSPSGQKRAVLREGQNQGSSSSGSKEIKKHYIEVWSENSMTHQFDLSKFSVHGDVYTDTEFGGFEWSTCETKILYTAEKKVPKNVSFLDYKAKEESNTDEPSEKVVPGGEYVFSQDWGEKLVDRVWPVLAIADMTKNEVQVILADSLEKMGLALGQGVWGPNGTSIVAVRYEMEARKLGKIYCSNRPLSIVSIEMASGLIDTLSAPDMSAFSPHVSPDGSKVIWMERKGSTGPHLTCNKLVSYSFADKQRKVVVDGVKTEMVTANGKPFYGLYNITISNSWLSDGKTIIISTEQKCSVKTYAIDTGSGSVTEIAGSDDWSQRVLHVAKNYIICSKSNLNHHHGVVVAEASDLNKLQWIELVAPKPISEDYKVEIFHLQSPNKDDSFRDFNAIYFGPKEGSKVNLIVWSHGGPHSLFPNSYNKEAQFFAKLGFAMVMVNYRGSTGAGSMSIEWLLGRVGSSDVSDVNAARDAMLKAHPELNSDSTLAYGGSHGGFLTLHLVGQYPSFYSAASTRNPVTYIPALAAVSDIPDWAFAESGIGEYNVNEPRQLTGADVEKMADMSPQRYVRNVTASVLLLLGKKDLRVPPSQGLNYYYALKAANKAETKLLMYDDNHSLSKSPNNTDFLINTGLWFLKNTAK